MKIIKIITKSEIIVKVDDEDVKHFDNIANMIKSLSPQLRDAVVGFEIMPDDTLAQQDWTEPKESEGL